MPDVRNALPGAGDGVLSAARLVALTLSLLALAACSQSTEPAASATPTLIALPSHPAPGFDVLITDLQNQVWVRLGQKIEVFIRTRPGMFAWSGLGVDDSSILGILPSGIAPVEGATVAGYVAKGTGVANITAFATAPCPANPPSPWLPPACVQPRMQFLVRVTVS